MDKQKVIKIDGVESVIQTGDKVEIVLKSRDTLYNEWFNKHGDKIEGVGWDDPGHQKFRLDTALKLIKESEKPTVLDIGCGTGTLFEYLKKNGVDCDYRGYEPNMNYFDKCLKKGIHAQPKELDEIWNRWDYIIALGTLHIGFDGLISEAVSKMWEHANKGLFFTVLTYPPGFHYSSIPFKEISDTIKNLSPIPKSVEVLEISKFENGFIIRR